MENIGKTATKHPDWVIICAGISGALAVGMGAFGTHGLADLLATNGKTAIYETAVFYHLSHTIVILGIGLIAKSNQILRNVALLFLVGVFIFSGSLYVLALTNQSWLGAITPVGGVAFILGWLALIYFGIKKGA